MILKAINDITQFINNNDLEHALDLILQKEDLLKEESEFWNLKGILCIKAKEYLIAYECVKKAIDIDNTKSEYYYNLAYILELQEMYSESAIYYGLAKKYSQSTVLKDEIEQIYNNNIHLLNIKKCAESSKKKNFIILSSCGFGEILQRMHHISKSLYKLGHDVSYICPTTEVNTTSKEISYYQTLEYMLKEKRNIDGIDIYQAIRVTNENNVLSDGYIHIIQHLINESKNEVILIAYLPYQVEYIKKLNGKFKVIYECVDDHSDFEYAFWGNKKDVLWEQELMDISDAITTTATSLYLQRVSIEKRKNVYISRNAVSERDFIFNSEEIPEDLKDIPEPRIIYSGAIYDWFDKELFYQVVKSNPDKSFVIIGFGNEEILNEEYTNLYLLGSKKHSELKKYLSHCQVGIIPFKDNTDLIINCDPIKQYEYIACSLPVVSTYMPECLFGKINTFSANNIESFNEKLEKALNLEIDKTIKSNFLIENSWNERAAHICNIIDNSITIEEKKKEFQKIGKELDTICSNEKAPVFETLRGMYLNLYDSKLFMRNCEKIYNINNCRFVEKQYLNSLLINNELDYAVKVVLESNKINNEIKSELLFRKKINDIEAMKIILYLCINDFKISIELLNNMSDKNVKILYKLFIEYMTGNVLDFDEIKNLKLRKYTSPLLDCIWNEFCMKRKRITILVPTKDRPELLERCIDYFEKISNYELEITMFILDASCKENSKINKNIVNCKNLNIKYFSFSEDSNQFSRIIKVYNDIDTDFCCLCADDDFLCKEGLIKSIEVLIKKNNVVAVKGKSYIFIENNTKDIFLFPKDSCVNLVEKNPLDRLNKLVNNWVPQLYYLVYRKNDLYTILSEFIENDEDKINDTVFEEYLLYFLVTLYGEIVNIDEPLNIRNESIASDGYRIPGFYRHTLDRNINKYYIKFKNKIISFCKNKNIMVEESDIDLIFSKFLKNSWNIDERYINLYIDCLEDRAVSVFNCELLEVGFKQQEKKLKAYKNIFIEISGKCNAKCKWCVTGNNNLKGLSKGTFISLENFQNAILYMREKDIITQETNIALYNWGEPFLNPNYNEIIKFLDEENMKFSLSTNASKIIEYPEKNIYRNLSFITFSMPGFSQLSYDKIHGFKFEKIKSNIIEILKRLRYGGFTGTAIMAYHVYQFNIHEIEKAKKFAAENNIRLECSYAYINDYKRSKEYLKSDLGYEELKEMSEQLILYQYNEERRKECHNYICPQHNYLTINENLQVELCCVNKDVIGDLMDMELDDIINIRKNNKRCIECNELGIDYYANNPLFLN